MATLAYTTNKREHKYGFLTTRQNKSQVIDGLVKLLREGTHGIRNRETIRELKFYQIDAETGRMGAVEGKYDDRVMSYGIAQYVRAGNPLPGAWDKEQRDGQFGRRHQEVQAGGGLNKWV